MRLWGQSGEKIECRRSRP